MPALVLALGTPAAVFSHCVGERAKGARATLRAEIIVNLGCQRPVEARFSGPFPFAAWAGGCIGRVDRGLAIVDRKARRLLEDRPSPRVLSDVGLLALLDQRVDQAIEWFEKSVDGKQPDVACLTDLGAGYLARAALPGSSRPDDLVAGLAALEKALDADPNNAAARFDRALALEHLGLRHEARKAWEEVSRSEPDPEWAAEARARAQALSAPSPVERWRGGERQRLYRAGLLGNSRELGRIVEAFPDFARIFAEQDLLGRWAEAAAQGQERIAARRLDLVRQIGKTLADTRCDHFLADTVVAIDGAPIGSVTRIKLIEGHRAFWQALKAEQQDRYSEGETAYPRAAELLAPAGSPFARAAVVREAVCAYYCNHHPRALKLFTEGIAGVDPRRYPTLVGYDLWMRGVVEFVTAALPEALKSHNSALALFQRVREPASIAFVHLLIGQDLNALGERDQAWEHELRSLGALGYFEDPRRVFSITRTASETALTHNSLELALHCTNELVEIIRYEAPPVVLAESLSRRGFLEGQQGDTTAALRDLQTAKYFARKVPVVYRPRISVDLLVAEAQVRRRHNPRVSIKLMTDALTYFRGADYKIDSAIFHEELAAAYRALGDFEHADKNLESAIATYETLHHGSDHVEERADLEHVQSVFDDLIALRLDRGQTEMAFAAVIRGSMISGGAQPSSLPPNASLLLKQVPTDAAMVEYSLLKDRLAIWVVTRSRLRIKVLPVHQQDIAYRVYKFRRQILEERESTEGEFLYEDLIRPISDYLGKANKLILIPDKSLHLLPFSALFNRQRKKFLIQEYAIAISPTTAINAMSGQCRGQRDSAGPTALIVAADIFDRARFRDLPPLTGTLKEADNIAKLYPHAKLLSGLQATRASLLRFFPRFGIVHLGGHSVAMGNRVAQSVFLLSPQGDHDHGALSVADLFKLDLSCCRLVVLASCSSAADGTLTNHHLFSLANPFLRSGVPVVASLWRLPDDVSTAFFDVFHRNVARGDDIVSALQKAQVGMIYRAHRHAPISQWAGMEVLGTIATTRSGI